MGLIAETLEKSKNNGVAGDQGFIDLLSNTNEKYHRLTGSGSPNTESDQKRLESFIKANEQAEAISFLQDQVSNPEFIRNFDDYTNKSLVDFASEVTRKHPDKEDEKLSSVVELLTDFLNRQKQFGLFQKLAEEAQQVFMETMDQRQMINHIAKAIITIPESVESSYFYENQEAVNAAKEIHKKICGKGVGEAYQA
jgi:hypothetical protein